MRAASWIEGERLLELSAESAAGARGRKNWNLHRMEDPVHRLVNAIEPGSYVRPHRHLHPPKSETVIRLRGRIGTVIFSPDGEIAERKVLDETTVLGVDLSPELWHSFVALVPGSVFFETKPGPYEPTPEIDQAPWAPAEGSPDAAEYERSLRRLF